MGILGVTAGFGGSTPLLSKQFWRDLLRQDVGFEVSYILDSSDAGAVSNKLKLEIRNQGRSKLFMPLRLSCYPEMPFEAPNTPAFIYLTLDDTPEASKGPSLTSFSYRIENRPSPLEMAPLELNNLDELFGNDPNAPELRNTAFLQFFCNFSILDERNSENSFPLYLQFFGAQVKGGDESVDFVMFRPSDVSIFLP